MILKILIITKLVSALSPQFEVTLNNIKTKKTNMITIKNEIIGEEESKILVNILKHIKHAKLKFEKCKMLNNGALRFAHEIKNLPIDSLTLKDIHISEIGIVEIIRGLKSSKVNILELERLGFSDLVVEEVLKILKSSEISYLHFIQMKINKSSVSKLAESLKNSKLKWLQLSQNGIENDGAEEIGNAMKSSNINTFKFSSDRMNNFGYINLIKLLSLSKVTKLFLRNLNLNGYEIVKVREMIKNNKILLMLDGIKDELIEQYIKRNFVMFMKAQKTIQLYKSGALEYNSKFREELAAFEVFSDVDELWVNNYKDKLGITKNIKLGIMKNFLKIAKVNKKGDITTDDDIKNDRKNFASLPREMQHMIFKKISISDVL